MEAQQTLTGRPKQCGVRRWSAFPRAWLMGDAGFGMKLPGRWPPCWLLLLRCRGNIFCKWVIEEILCVRQPEDRLSDNMATARDLSKVTPGCYLSFAPVPACKLLRASSAPTLCSSLRLALAKGNERLKSVGFRMDSEHCANRGSLQPDQVLQLAWYNAEAFRSFFSGLPCLQSPGKQNASK